MEHRSDIGEKVAALQSRPWRTGDCSDCYTLLAAASHYQALIAELQNPPPPLRAQPAACTACTRHERRAQNLRAVINELEHELALKDQRIAELSKRSTAERGPATPAAGCLRRAAEKAQHQEGTAVRSVLLQILPHALAKLPRGRLTELE
jgi:hypothetical protein